MKALNIVLGLLLLAALLGLAYCQNDFKTKISEVESKVSGLTSKNQSLSAEIADVQSLKADLEKQVRDLESKYSDLANENESLKGSVKDAKSEIYKRRNVITQLTEDMQAKDGEMASLRAQISSLLGVKSQLESEITSLKAENTSLKAENQQLVADLKVSKEEKAELARLNATIQEEVANLTLENFKANGFTVEVEKGNTKATAKSRLAKKVTVSFDLVGVPEKYQGVRDLYLVITDESGVPIKKTNPIATTVSLNGQNTDIMAISKQSVDIAESQRLNFSHDLEEKLKKGFYRASVYSNIGLLGSSSFRLR